MYPMHAAITNDWRLAARILSYTPLFEAPILEFPEGCAKPVDVAAYRGSTKVMDILLDRGADINGCTGKTILHIAVEHNPEMLSHLLEERKLNPNLENYYGPPIFETLHRCSAPDGISLRSLEILLKNGADPNYQRKRKNVYEPVSAYMLAEAASKPCSEMVKLLLDYGADPKLVVADVRKYALKFHQDEPDLNAMDRNVREAYVRDTPNRLARRAKIDGAVRLIEQAAKENE